jgi:molybdopterin-guanine dinucleotide biosynthesis adapter protein
VKVLGIIGKSGFGKTTLIARLIGELSERRFSVSTIKYAKDGVDLDQPGKDSYVHRQSGAREVAIVTPSRWALLHERRGSVEFPPVADLIAAMSPVDVLLIEGLQENEFDYIEIQREGREGLEHDHRRRIAIVSDKRNVAATAPNLDINAPGEICDFLLRHWKLHEHTCPHPHGSAISSP